MNTKSKKTILVTGGAGFIGSNLCERLIVEDYNVISLDNYFTGNCDNHIPGVDYRKGHTKDIEQLVPETPELVYHLGEYSRTERSLHEPNLVFNLNSLGTFAVIEYCRKKKSKLLYAGSSTKFADGGIGRDQSPYAFTKASNTELVRNYGAWYNMSYAITYFYNVYGPRERSGAYGTVIEIFRQKILAGEPLCVNAPGTQRRNFTHIDDIIDGLILVGEQGEGDEFGIGNPEEFSILEIARLFGGEIVMKPEVPGNRMESLIDISRTSLLGWKPKRFLRDYIAAVKKETK